MQPEFPVENAEDQGKACSRRKAHSGQRGSDVSKLPASTLCISIILELQWKIFQLVHDATDKRLGKKTLLALALTCKSFTGPALKLLWQDLSGLAPLIKCLPQSLWKQVGRRLEFQRVMTVDDWSIFCKYNNHVRSLVIHDYYYGDSLVDDEIWRALSRPPFNSLPLLPNLMSLAWHNASRETFLYIPLFVSPTITKLKFFPSTFGPVEHSILLCISMLCPLVSHFHFDPQTESAEDSSTALQSWSHLTSVITGEVSEAAILYLSKLPSLRFLQLELPSTPISVDTQKLQHPVFCTLEKLVVKSSSLVFLDAFLERFFIAPKSISLDITGGMDSARVLPALISRLSNGCAQGSLECMQFYIANRFTDHITSIRIAVLRPLFAFCNLRELNFAADCNYIFRWDDAVFLQIAKAWPLLEVLHLNRSHHSSHGVTPSAFVSLLQHCPCLVSVAIIVNWSTIDGRDISPDAPYRGFSHKTLSRAFFGSPRIRHPARIAAFISAIAPNLVSISTWERGNRTHSDSDKYSTRWKCVRDLIKTFSTVREQWRRMVLNGGAGADGHEGPHNHGIAQPAHETENGDSVIGGGDQGDSGDVFEEDGGSEDYSEYTSEESSEE